MSSHFIFRINMITVFVLLAGFVSPSLATPPQMSPTWDNPVNAYVVFPAGQLPDEHGAFEVEVFCEAVYDIAEIALSVGSSEEITFDEDPPQFEGSLKAGESKVWRVKGTVSAIPVTDGLGMPAAIHLSVEYLFPYEAVLKELTQRKDPDAPYALRELEKEKGKRKTIIKSLPIEILKSPVM